MDSFLVYAFVSGVGISLITGPLGSLIIWRRMAFFGDTLAHSALTGVALGLLFNHSVLLGTIGVPIVVAVFLAYASSKDSLSLDTWLAVLTQGTLAIGLFALSFVKTPLDLNSYLFGDILTVNSFDLWLILAVDGVILSILVWIWQPLLTATISEELAAVAGISVIFMRVILMLMIALTVAIALKIFGILLLTALLIIPAATARQFSRSPEHMAVSASLISILIIGCGLYGSFVWDTPASATIVFTGLILFGFSWLLPCKQ